MAKRPLSTVNSILNRVVSDLGLDKRLREHTFMSLWPTFVNSTLAERSRPLFIDSQANLVVSVADAATGQELSMLKGKLFLQLRAAARSLGIEIGGLRLDLKHYHERSLMPPMPEPQTLPRASDGELAALVVNEAERRQLEDLAKDLQHDASISEENKARILTLFEKQLRMRQFRLTHGYPVCPACLQPVERLHNEAERRGDARRRLPQFQQLCLACLYSS